jgi:hypothetical protein
VHLQQQGGPIGGGAVVGEPRAVGRAHLDQVGTGQRHDLGYAETTTDLDQLAPRDHDRPFGGQGGEHQQDRGGAVVDDEGGLGAAGSGQQRACMLLPRAAVAGGEVELEIRVAGALGHRQWRPSEVGVEQHTGPVDHRLQ